MTTKKVCTTRCPNIIYSPIGLAKTGLYTAFVCHACAICGTLQVDFEGPGRKVLPLKKKS